MSTVRTWQLSQAGIEHLQCVERPSLTLQRQQVRVRMRASSLNARDRSIVAGHLPGVQWPRVPLSDGAGVITEVGTAVKRLRVGMRVCPMFFPHWTDGAPTPQAMSASLAGEVDGVMAASIIADERALAEAPAHLDDVESATLCCAGLTAWSALVEVGRIAAGDTVLLQGTGGVSLFGLQIAKAVGARAVLISGSDDKLARARVLGADVTINYRNDTDWARTVLAATDGKGVQIALDVGGAATLGLSAQALSVGGRICSIGILGGVELRLPIVALLRKAATLHGVIVGSRGSFERMSAFLTRHDIHPVIDRVFDVDDLQSALQRMESGSHFGKIGLRFPQA